MWYLIKTHATIRGLMDSKKKEGNRSKEWVGLPKWSKARLSFHDLVCINAALVEQRAYVSGLVLCQKFRLRNGTSESNQGPAAIVGTGIFCLLTNLLLIIASA